MCRSISLGAKTLLLAVLAVLLVPQTSEAQYFFGRGGVYYGIGGRTPYAIPGFFGPAYRGYGMGGYPAGGYFGGGGSFAYASAYANTNPAPPIIIHNNIYTTPGATQQPANPPAEMLVNPTPGNKATIDVIVPADAELWFNGAKTKLTGETRTFVTPPLAEGNYSYELRATWKDEGGKEVSRTSLVHIAPNQQLTVNLVTGTQELKKAP